MLVGDSNQWLRGPQAGFVPEVRKGAKERRFDTVLAALPSGGELASVTPLTSLACGVPRGAGARDIPRP